jgi:hypothetical protein
MVVVGDRGGGAEKVVERWRCGGEGIREGGEAVFVVVVVVVVVELDVNVNLRAKCKSCS